MSQQQKSATPISEAMGGFMLIIAVVCLIVWAFGADRFAIAAAWLGAPGLVLVMIGAARSRRA